MDLPESWVDRIFEKLIVTYGREFTDRWTGLDMSAVKADWAHELGYFAANPGAIGHVLQHLPSKPPTVSEFKRIAKECTTAKPAGLLEDKTDVKADPQRVASLLSRLNDKPEEASMRQWAYDLMARHNGGDLRPIACVRLAKQAIAIDQGES